ncbi:glycosyltransferase [Cellulomonas hominis]
MTTDLEPAGALAARLPTPPLPGVTAVVVTRGATAFLPVTLRALAAQARRPGRIVVVDAAAAPGDDVGAVVRDVFSGTSSGALPGGWPGAEGSPLVHVLRVPRARTFGDAVRGALASLPGGGPATGSVASVGTETPGGSGGSGPSAADRRWLWLLHDDSAPEPTALAELVRAVELAPSVGVAGVKQLTWTRPTRLREVGLRTSRSGRRMSDVADGEVDQGQHDGRDDVLGVGIAGALVRRDVWDRLGGTDPALGPFGDGLDLSRRARLAGHRVVVVPAAEVRHAQASYHGLRGGDSDQGLDAMVDLDADGDPDTADPRRSFAARRRALLHQRLVSASPPLVPFVALLALVVGAVRSVVRLATKEPLLAVAELTAPLAALGRPHAVLRARATARRNRRLPRRALRPLQADARDVWGEYRDRWLTRTEARKVHSAPSELELRELAALATRRRRGLGALTVVLLALAAVALGPLAVRVSGGQTLVGGALLPAASRLGGLWDAATSGWVANGLGAPGPADALLTALLPGTAVVGGSLATAVAVLLLGALVLAGLGAWFAAGAATRSVGVRVWAAVVWAGAPALLLAVGDGRLGAVLVHVALPWCVLGLARAVGVQQVDEVLPGVLTARREQQEAQDEREAQADREALAERAARRARIAREAQTTDAAHAGDAADTAGVADATDVADGLGVADATDVADGAGVADATDVADGLGVMDAVDAAHAGGAADPVRAAAAAQTVDVVDALGTTRRTRAVQTTLGDGEPGSADHPVDVLPAVIRPTGSVAAAAGAALAFAVVVAGAPALLLPGIALLVAAALCAPRGRRRRVVLVAVPALVLLGPTLAEAASRGREGWRLLVADPGPALASAPVDSLHQLLGLPAEPGQLAPGSVTGLVQDVWPVALGGVVLVLAVLALLRGAPVARGVRLAWLAAAVGLAVAVVSERVATGVSAGAVVRGWPGAGVSLATAGLLTAAVLGTRGMRERLTRSSFGWRQPLAAVVVVVAVLVPTTVLGSWAWRVYEGTDRDTGAVGELTTLDRPVVSAVGRQVQQSTDDARVLALAVGADGTVGWQLLRGDGAQLVDESAAVGTRTLSGGLAVPEVAGPDDATAELESVVGALAVAASGDVSADLAALAVADVLVPPVPAAALAQASGDDGSALTTARSDLVGRLDSTAGLERITENESGVIWRVQAAAATPGAEPVDVVTAWARLVPDATATSSAADLSGPTAVAVEAHDRTVDTTIPAGAAGRLLVLAERQDGGWRATLDGAPLRSVSDGWRQTFEVGADGGRLVVEHRAPDRVLWLVAQGVVVLVTVLLAVPVRRRRAGRR